MSRTRGVFPLLPREDGGQSLSCVGCRRTLGSHVVFCPFCGVAVGDKPVTEPVQPPTATSTRPPASPTPTSLLAIAPAAGRGTVPGQPATGFVLTGDPRGDVGPQPPVTPPDIPPAIEEAGSGPSRPGPHQTKQRSRLKWLAIVALAVAAVYICTRWATPEPKGTLLVHVTSAAGALVTSGDVTINDVSVGRPDQMLTVRVGTVRVGFALPGWTADPRSVTIGSGAETRLELVVRLLPVRITVTSNPTDAAIAIGGRTLGRTPLNLDLVPQAYRILATRDGHVNKTVDLMVKLAEPQTLSLDLVPNPSPPAPVVPPPPVPVAPSFFAAPFENGATRSSVLLYPSPSRGGAPIATLAPDTEVTVLGRVEAEERWLQIRAGGRTGFVPATGTVEPWENWVRRHTVTGVLQEVSPGLRATIGGAVYALNGVKPPDQGSLSRLATMQGALARQLLGSNITCVPKATTRFECKTADSIDIGEYYILNGAALPSDGGPGYYFESLQRARANKKGIWAE